MPKRESVFGSNLSINQIKSQKYFSFLSRQVGQVFECHDQNRTKSDFFSSSEAAQDYRIHVQGTEEGRERERERERAREKEGNGKVVIFISSKNSQKVNDQFTIIT
jgi:hypothetical protein